MSEDPRCCGSGTCIIDPEGRCWCGQQWDGRQMCPADPSQQPMAAAAERRAAHAAGERVLDRDEGLT
jgi:hypothetical protein